MALSAAGELKPQTRAAFSELAGAESVVLWHARGSIFEYSVRFGLCSQIRVEPAMYFCVPLRAAFAACPCAHLFLQPLTTLAATCSSFTEWSGLAQACKAGQRLCRDLELESESATSVALSLLKHQPCFIRAVARTGQVPTLCGLYF